MPYKYSEPQNRIYQNTASYILKYDCVKSDQKTLDWTNWSQKIYQLSYEVILLIYMRRIQLSQYSPVSIWWIICYEIAEITYRHKQVHKFDISRQYTTLKIIEQGVKAKQKALRFLLDITITSSLIINHWSHNETNFVGIIGKALKNGEIREYLLSLQVADSNKSAFGINSNVISILGLNSDNCATKIPVITDNTNSMVFAFNTSETWNHCFYKIFCVKHLLAKIDEQLHKCEIFAKFDKFINSIDSYFDYRSEKFDIPLKPLTTRSTTRLWHSFQRAYEITLRNYDRCQSIKKETSNFPNLPDYIHLKLLSEFRSLFFTIKVVFLNLQNFKNLNFLL